MAGSNTAACGICQVSYLRIKKFDQDNLTTSQPGSLDDRGRAVVSLVAISRRVSYHGHALS